MGLKSAILTGAAVLALSVPASAADYSKSSPPGYPDVIAEYLQIPGYQAAGTPKGLNTATFLRVRAAADGEAPKPANAVIVGLPGFASTPAHWLYLASQLVHRAQGQTCEGKPCRVEVWVLQRRGANLAQTEGLREARVKKDPAIALDHYLGAGSLVPSTRPGEPAKVTGAAVGKWTPLTQTDAAFMADWDFQAYAGDVDAMIGLVREKTGNRNIFLAGHSQGGGFVANYAARRQADGRRGVEKLSGLIFLDGGPSVGNAEAPSPKELDTYFAKVADFRSGKARVYTDASGMLGAIAGPMAAASQSVTGIYYAFADPKAEAIFPLRTAAMVPANPGDDFLKAVRLTWLARAGTSFDTDPVPGGGVQMPVLQFLGESLGYLDFNPVPGTEAACDKTPAPMMMGPPRPGAPKPDCVPSAAQVDPARVYDWVEGGGNGGSALDVGKARLWLESQAFAPSRSNIRPVSVAFKGGARTIDASNMIASNWYPSERWDYDAQFVGRFKTFVVDRDGVKLDVDKNAIANVPVYVARQSPAAAMGNPFPGVSDFTEVNKTGTWQTNAAKAITAFDPKINARLYFHTDFVSADDSTPDKGTPGDPGNSAVAATLTDWVLKRSKGVAATPTPRALGVRETY